MIRLIVRSTFGNRVVFVEHASNMVTLGHGYLVVDINGRKRFLADANIVSQENV